MLISYFFLLGAIIGSFCNVIIYRLPRMLHGEELSLSWPASHCPHCKKSIRAHHNIPLLSWIMLHGRCAGCRQVISSRYFFVEALLACLYGTIVWQQNLTPQSAIDLLAVTLLIPLFFIDLQTMLLPDRLTITLLVATLLLAVSGYGVITLSSALAAAGLGYGVPWLLSFLCRLLRGYEGMGKGDMKLLAALGAWLGPQALLDIVTAASLLALGTSLVLFRVSAGERFPFGPYPIIIALAWLLIWR